jgi:hypothetical protein
MKNLWIPMLCIAGMSVSTMAVAADVSAIDAWGRYVPAFDLAYKTEGKTQVYVPQGHFYVMAKGAESDDIITAQYYLGDKPFGEALKCPVELEDLSGSDSKIAVAHGCTPDLDANGISKPATFTVKLGYKQVSAGKEFKDIASYTFSVAEHAGAGGTKEFHVDYDFRMGEAWIHRLGDGQVNLFAWFKESRDPKTDTSAGKMRCSIGDKKWEFAEMTNSRWSHEYDDYAAVKAGEPAKVRWTYQYFFPTGDTSAWMQENPGDYRCVYTRNGEAEREFFFAIKDGAFVKPKCQQGDSPRVIAPPATTFIKQVMKAPGDVKFDAGAFAKSGLFGKGGTAEACGF